MIVIRCLHNKDRHHWSAVCRLIGKKKALNMTIWDGEGNWDLYLQTASQGIAGRYVAYFKNENTSFLYPGGSNMADEVGADCEISTAVHGDTHACKQSWLGWSITARFKMLPENKLHNLYLNLSNLSVDLHIVSLTVTSDIRGLACRQRKQGLPGPSMMGHALLASATCTSSLTPSYIG